MAPWASGLAADSPVISRASSSAARSIRSGSPSAPQSSEAAYTPVGTTTARRWANSGRRA
jgi:hypothetical protein